jgi:uncharacterized sporulation protein YeaH/YhbH (DUF444 family)
LAEVKSYITLAPAGRRFPALKQQEHAMATTAEPTSAEFQRGWDAAILAARTWHEAKARQAMVQARRSRFPKALEREAEFHTRSAEMLLTLSPDDV